MNALAGFLDVLRPSLGAVLPDEDVRRIAARAAGIPLDPLALVGFEIPLTGGPADLSVMLASPRVLRRCAAGWDAPLGSGSLGALLAALTDRGHPLHRQVSDAWLEFDVGSGSGARPSLLAAPAAMPTASALARVLGAAPRAVEGLDRLLERTGAPVQHVGVMHGRAGSELRVILRGVDVPAAARPLVDVDAPAAARPLVDRYAELTPRHSVALGIDGDGLVRPKVGVELHLPRREDAERVLALLESEGLADPGTTARLLGWHGHQFAPGGAGLPYRLRALHELTGGRLAPAIVRRVHHVKVGLEPGRPPTAKAYLGATPVTTGLPGAGQDRAGAVDRDHHLVP
jgi:hypothetical protein